MQKLLDSARREHLGFWNNERYCIMSSLRSLLGEEKVGGVVTSSCQPLINNRVAELRRTIENNLAYDAISLRCNPSYVPSRIPCND